MKFYRLHADPEAIDRWYLKAPVSASGEEVDPRIFTEGVMFSPAQDLSVPIRRAGSPVDFNFCDFDMIVSPADLNMEIEQVINADIQRVPIRIEHCARDFEILNVLRRINCIDENASCFTKWNATDGRPDKVGRYRMITSLRIDRLAAEGHHLFRVNEWPIALIASERIKLLMEKRGVTGARFEPVG